MRQSVHVHASKCLVLAEFQYKFQSLTEGPMSKFLAALAGSIVFACVNVAVSFEANAADVSVPRIVQRGAELAGRYCQDIQRCGPDGCNTFHVCTRACPDGNSCAPLYGAYGPWGGTAYWGGYTDSGWSYYR